MARFPLTPLAWLSWQARGAWRRWGGATILGVACLAAATALAWQARAWQREAASERDALVALRSRSTPAAPEEPDAAARLLRGFVAALPARAAAVDEVGHLFDLARDAGVQLDQGDYRWVGDAAAGIHRYQMSFPIKGEALKTQRFVIASLAAIPSLSLRSIAFHRDSPASPLGEARIDFDLLTRPE